MVDSASEDSAPPQRSERPRVPVAVLVGVVLGIGLSVYVARRYLRDPLPELSAQQLQEATARWRASGVKDYRVEVEVQSRQTEHYQVEVQEGSPRQAWRNGRPLTQTRVFDTWSVPGMLTTISDDLDRATAPGGEGTRLTLRCQFDSQTGAPVHYRRIEWGSDLEVSWRITKLEAASADGSRRSLLEQPAGSAED